MSGCDDKFVYQICFTTQFVYLSHALKLNPIDYLRCTNCYGKANKAVHALAWWQTIGHELLLLFSIISPCSNIAL